ncbi:MAG TPA: cation diffusion facilitator family transporter [Myxococcales bacterium]|jgi:cobalt-zinc-cadmium efflux system protein|nr:cation diffusion facilitator family transporter [Myxococcales bacterium]
MQHDHHHHDGHDHGHSHAGPSRAGEGRRLTLALGIAIVAMTVEALGGWASNSLALLSDAGHMMADAGAIALSLFALKVSTKPADGRRTYGYYRLEILAALVNGLVLFGIAAGIAIEGYHRLLTPEPVQVKAVLYIACAGIVLNGVGMYVTHSGEGGSMNLRSTFLHLAGDLLNSVGVLVSGGLIALTGKLAVDPIVSFLIAGTIIWSAIRLCREAVHVLLEGVPRHLSVPDVEGALGKVAGVEAVHDMHVWTITSGMVALSCHIVVVCDGPGCRSHDQILTDAKAVLKDRFAIEHTTIQFESESYQHEEVVH